MQSGVFYRLITLRRTEESEFKELRHLFKELRLTDKLHYVTHYVEWAVELGITLFRVTLLDSLSP